MATTASENQHLPHPAPEAEEVYRRWLQFLDDEFTRHCSLERRSEIVRDQLTQLYLGRPLGGKQSLTLTSELPGNVLALSLDPMNVTMEAEHFADIDRERYARRKPLLWFWKMFDRSSIGLNHWLGIRFRCMLGRHIFENVGTSVKIHHGIDITYGYNMWIGDNVVIRQHALFNDRGGIRIGNNAVIGSYARIYSQVHDRQHFEQVRLQTTVIGNHARIGSHEIVLAGQSVPDGTTLGSFPAEDR